MSSPSSRKSGGLGQRQQHQHQQCTEIFDESPQLAASLAASPTAAQQQVLSRARWAALRQALLTPPQRPPSSPGQARPPFREHPPPVGEGAVVALAGEAATVSAMHYSPVSAAPSALSTATTSKMGFAGLTFHRSCESSPPAPPLGHDDTGSTIAALLLTAVMLSPREPPEKTGARVLSTLEAGLRTGAGGGDVAASARSAVDALAERPSAAEAQRGSLVAAVVAAAAAFPLPPLSVADYSSGLGCSGLDNSSTISSRRGGCSNVGGGGGSPPIIIRTLPAIDIGSTDSSDSSGRTPAAAAVSRLLSHRVPVTVAAAIPPVSFVAAPNDAHGGSCDTAVVAPVSGMMPAAASESLRSYPSSSSSGSSSSGNGSSSGNCSSPHKAAAAAVFQLPRQQDPQLSLSSRGVDATGLAREWPSESLFASLLCRWAVSYPNMFRGASVIELGAGTGGVAGRALALAAPLLSRVVVTDGHPGAAAALRRNVLLQTLPALASSIAASSSSAVVASSSGSASVAAAVPPSTSPEIAAAGETSTALELAPAAATSSAVLESDVLVWDAESATARVCAGGSYFPVTALSSLLLREWGLHSARAFLARLREGNRGGVTEVEVGDRVFGGADVAQSTSTSNSTRALAPPSDQYPGVTLTGTHPTSTSGNETGSLVHPTSISGETSLGAASAASSSVSAPAASTATGGAGARIFNELLLANTAAQAANGYIAPAQNTRNDSSSASTASTQQQHQSPVEPQLQLEQQQQQRPAQLKLEQHAPPSASLASSPLRSPQLQLPHDLHLHAAPSSLGPALTSPVPLLLPSTAPGSSAHTLVRPSLASPGPTSTSSARDGAYFNFGGDFASSPPGTPYLIGYVRALPSVASAAGLPPSPSLEGYYGPVAVPIDSELGRPWAAAAWAAAAMEAAASASSAPGSPVGGPRTSPRTSTLGSPLGGPRTSTLGSPLGGPRTSTLALPPPLGSPLGGGVRTSTLRHPASPSAQLQLGGGRHGSKRHVHAHVHAAHPGGAQVETGTHVEADALSSPTSRSSLSGGGGHNFNFSAEGATGAHIQGSPMSIAGVLSPRHPHPGEFEPLGTENAHLPPLSIGAPSLAAAAAAPASNRISSGSGSFGVAATVTGGNFKSGSALLPPSSSYSAAVTDGNFNLGTSPLTSSLEGTFGFARQTTAVPITASAGAGAGSNGVGGGEGALQSSSPAASPSGRLNINIAPSLSPSLRVANDPRAASSPTIAASATSTCAPNGPGTATSTATTVTISSPTVLSSPGVLNKDEVNALPVSPTTSTRAYSAVVVGNFNLGAAAGAGQQSTLLPSKAVSSPQPLKSLLYPGKAAAIVELGASSDSSSSSSSLSNGVGGHAARSQVEVGVATSLKGITSSGGSSRASSSSFNGGKISGSSVSGSSTGVSSWAQLAGRPQPRPMLQVEVQARPTPQSALSTPVAEPALQPPQSAPELQLALEDDAPGQIVGDDASDSDGGQLQTAKRAEGGGGGSQPSSSSLLLTWVGGGTKQQRTSLTQSSGGGSKGARKQTQQQRLSHPQRSSTTTRPAGTAVEHGLQMRSGSGSSSSSSGGSSTPGSTPHNFNLGSTAPPDDAASFNLGTATPTAASADVAPATPTPLHSATSRPTFTLGSGGGSSSGRDRAERQKAKRVEHRFALREYAALERRAKSYLTYLEAAASSSSVPWSMGAAWASAVAAVLPSPGQRADAAAAAIAAAVAVLPDDTVAVAQTVAWLVDVTAAVTGAGKALSNLPRFPLEALEYPYLRVGEASVGERQVGGRFNFNFGSPPASAAPSSATSSGGGGGGKFNLGSPAALAGGRALPFGQPPAVETSTLAANGGRQTTPGASGALSSPSGAEAITLPSAGTAALPEMLSPHREQKQQTMAVIAAAASAQNGSAAATGGDAATTSAPKLNLRVVASASEEEATEQQQQLQLAIVARTPSMPRRRDAAGAAGAQLQLAAPSPSGALSPSFRGAQLQLASAGGHSPSLRASSPGGNHHHQQQHRYFTASASSSLSSRWSDAAGGGAASPLLTSTSMTPKGDNPLARFSRGVFFTEDEAGVQVEVVSTSSPLLAARLLPAPVALVLDGGVAQVAVDVERSLIAAFSTAGDAGASTGGDASGGAASTAGGISAAIAGVGAGASTSTAGGDSDDSAVVIHTTSSNGSGGGTTVDNSGSSTIVASGRDSIASSSGGASVSISSCSSSNGAAPLSGSFSSSRSSSGSSSAAAYDGSFDLVMGADTLFFEDRHADLLHSTMVLLKGSNSGGDSVLQQSKQMQQQQTSSPSSSPQNTHSAGVLRGWLPPHLVPQNTASDAVLSDPDAELLTLTAVKRSAAPSTSTSAMGLGGAPSTSTSMPASGAAAAPTSTSVAQGRAGQRIFRKWCPPGYSQLDTSAAAAAGLQVQLQLDASATLLGLRPQAWFFAPRRGGSLARFVVRARAFRAHPPQVEVEATSSVSDQHASQVELSGAFRAVLVVEQPESADAAATTASVDNAAPVLGVKASPPTPNFNLGVKVSPPASPTPNFNLSSGAGGRAWSAVVATTTSSPPPKLKLGLATMPSSPVPSVVLSSQPAASSAFSSASSSASFTADKHQQRMQLPSPSTSTLCDSHPAATSASAAVAAEGCVFNVRVYDWYDADVWERHEGLLARQLQLLQHGAAAASVPTDATPPPLLQGEDAASFDAFARAYDPDVHYPLLVVLEPRQP